MKDTQKITFKTHSNSTRLQERGLFGPTWISNTDARVFFTIITHENNKKNTKQVAFCPVIFRPRPFSNDGRVVYSRYVTIANDRLSLTLMLKPSPTQSPTQSTITFSHTHTHTHHTHTHTHTPYIHKVVYLQSHY